jgi:hypothetical protein
MLASKAERTAIASSLARVAVGVNGKDSGDQQAAFPRFFDCQLPISDGSMPAAGAAKSCTVV